MTFPLRPREAALLAEFIRVFDARLVSEGAELVTGPLRATGGEESALGATGATTDAPSLTEPLFPNEERAA